MVHNKVAFRGGEGRRSRIGLAKVEQKDALQRGTRWGAGGGRGHALAACAAPPAKLEIGWLGGRAGQRKLRARNGCGKALTGAQRMRLSPRLSAQKAGTWDTRGASYGGQGYIKGGRRAGEPAGLMGAQPGCARGCYCRHRTRADRGVQYRFSLSGGARRVALAGLLWDQSGGIRFWQCKGVPGGICRRDGGRGGEGRVLLGRYGAGEAGQAARQAAGAARRAPRPGQAGRALPHSTSLMGCSNGSALLPPLALEPAAASALRLPAEP